MENFGIDFYGQALSLFDNIQDDSNKESAILDIQATLEALYEEAYEQGKEEGEEIGYQNGYDEAKEEVYQTAYDEGFADGEMEHLQPKD